MSTQAKFDCEFVQGEFGDNYNFNIKNDDGTDADISGFDGVQLIIKTPDEVTTRLTLTNTNLTISSPKVIWAMQTGQTDYQGEHIAQIILTDTSPSRRRLVKVFTVFVYKKIS